MTLQYTTVLIDWSQRLLQSWMVATWLILEMCHLSYGCDITLIFCRWIYFFTYLTRLVYWWKEVCSLLSAWAEGHGFCFGSQVFSYLRTFFSIDIQSAFTTSLSLRLVYPNLLPLFGCQLLKSLMISAILIGILWWYCHRFVHKSVSFIYLRV